MSKGACGGASPGAASHRRLKAACLSRGPSKHVCHRCTAAVNWRCWRGRACVPPPRRVVSPAGGPCSPAARTRIDTACQPLHRGSGPRTALDALARRPSHAFACRYTQPLESRDTPSETFAFLALIGTSEYLVHFLWIY